MKKDPITFDPITKEQILAYAEASGDHNKIHLDEDYAKEAGLPGVIAHGMLSMGLAARALREWGIKSEQVLSLSSKFKEKVLPGDTLRSELISERNDAAEATIDIQIVNQENKLILTASAKYRL